MTKKLVASLFCSVILLVALQQALFGSGGVLLAPHASFAGDGGDNEVYFPIAQNEPPLIVPTPTPSAPVLVGAGDVADCGSPNDELTANLLDGIPGTVFTAGDNAYEDGAAEEFQNCYEPTWGRHKARTRPSAGNHDYQTEDAQGYFDYFGDVAGEPGRGYYSYDLGTWHIIVLNSNCEFISGGCDAGSRQERWLRRDLQANDHLCTLAYFHHPRFSSVSNSSSRRTLAFWQALYENGADVVISGHDHNYARFAPQDPDGNADPDGGIRQFIAGTGGRRLTNVAADLTNGEAASGDAHGVLKLTLHDGRYDWQFIPIPGQNFQDMGSDVCH